MSLTDLRQRYSPEQTVEERLKLLEVAATHLPAPEFLWYPVALEALASEEVALKRAALRLLAFAPQSWDQVLVTALTTADLDLQRVAIAALATQARAWPELIEAFGTLGGLPGWLPESLDVWRQAQAILQPVAADQPEAIAAERARLQARLDEAHTERDALRQQLSVVEGRLGQLQASASNLEQALDNERQGARAIGERMERMIAIHDADGEQWQREREAYDSLQKRHRLVMLGSAAMVALLVLVGGPMAWTLGSQRQAPAAMAAASAMPPAELEEELKAAEDAGYRRAIAALADHAGSLAHEGQLYPAVAAWQAYARLAPTPAEAQEGAKQSEALLARIRKTSPASQFGQLLAKRPHTLTSAVKVAAPAKEAHHAPKPRRALAAKPRVRHVPALAVTPPTLPSPAGAPAIPDQVRAKF